MCYQRYQVGGHSCSGLRITIVANRDRGASFAGSLVPVECRSGFTTDKCAALCTVMTSSGCSTGILARRAGIARGASLRSGPSVAISVSRKLPSDGGATISSTKSHTCLQVEIMSDIWVVSVDQGISKVLVSQILRNGGSKWMKISNEGRE